MFKLITAEAEAKSKQSLGLSKPGTKGRSSTHGHPRTLRGTPGQGEALLNLNFVMAKVAGSGSQTICAFPPSPPD